MHRIILVSIVVFFVSRLSGQAVIIITDKHQIAEQSILDAMAECAKGLIPPSAQAPDVFAFNCGTDGLHHASGTSYVLMHLDSLRSAAIPSPTYQVDWEEESSLFLPLAIRKNFSELGDGVEMFILVNELNQNDLKSEFLAPLALVFGLLDESGALLPEVKISVIHEFTANGMYSIEPITTLSL